MEKNSTENNATEAAISSFEECGIEDNLLAEIEKHGWKKPTPVQGLCLPVILSGQDVAGFAQTGTGKTGVFLISIANHLISKKMIGSSKEPKAVVLAPTRELADQISSEADDMLSGLGIKTLAVYGGTDYKKQAAKINEGVDLIVATPGRLRDYTQKKVIDLSKVEQFICDEADRMFDMGFIDDVKFFLGNINESTQKLLFSATTNDNIKELAFEFLNDPEYISVTPETITPEKIEQHMVMCETPQKLPILMSLLKEHNPECSIIFTNTKLVAEWIHYKLSKNGFDVDIITGDLPQKKRISLINRIKEGKLKALIATDVASRGIHISAITHVYNFDLPDEAANYVHRIGRTARAGKDGYAYSFVCEDYGHNLEDIRNYLTDKVPLTTEWFKEEWLAFEDKAPNPYTAEDFKGISSKNRIDRPQKSDDRKPRDNRKPRDRKDNNRKPHDRTNRNRKDRDYSKKKPHNKKQHNKKQHNNKKYDKKRTQSEPKKDTSLVGTVKSFFGALFGKRSNSSH